MVVVDGHVPHIDQGFLLLQSVTLSSEVISQSEVGFAVMSVMLIDQIGGYDIWVAKSSEFFFVLQRIGSESSYIVIRLIISVLKKI
jgi:hypothetical protein